MSTDLSQSMYDRCMACDQPDGEHIPFCQYMPDSRCDFCGESVCDCDDYCTACDGRGSTDTYDGRSPSFLGESVPCFECDGSGYSK